MRKSKNVDVFDDLIRQYQGDLYRHALWMTGSTEVAQDVVQETFFQAWSAINTLKQKDKALPWLLTILRRQVYKEQRHQYRQREALEQVSLFGEDSHHPDAQALIMLYGTLERISAKHRDVFLLHHLHGFSYDEISEQLQIPTGTVMSRLSRARQALQQIELNSEHDNVVLIDDVIRGK